MRNLLRCLVSFLTVLAGIGVVFAGAPQARGEPLSPAAAAGVAASQLSAPESHRSGPIHLYVNAATGSDGQKCDQPSKACRTLQAAFDLIPSIISSQATVHIAGGTYAGEAVLADRASPNRSPIRLVGEPRATISGGGVQRWGLTIFRVPGLVLQNLNIQDFTGAGVVITYTDPVSIRSSVVTDNAADGIVIRWSSAALEASTVQSNGGNGITAAHAYLTLGSSAVPQTLGGRGPWDSQVDSGSLAAYNNTLSPPVSALDAEFVAIKSNRGDGIAAEHSDVRFEGRTDIIGNGRGLHAVHGSEIDLDLRPDVRVFMNAHEQLLAECHGMVSNYSGASIGGTCEAAEYGICHP